MDITHRSLSPSLSCHRRGIWWIADLAKRALFSIPIWLVLTLIGRWTEQLCLLQHLASLLPSFVRPALLAFFTVGADWYHFVVLAGFKVPFAITRLSVP